MIAAAATTGYSGTPLPQKLGLKDGQRVLWISLPKELKDLRKSRDFVEVAEAGWDSFTDGDPGYDVIHGFTASRAVLEKSAKKLMRQIDRDGTIWYVNSGMGMLGRYDPKKGEFKEWPSPSGPRSHPYAIAVIDGIVWYNESGQRPDTLVRFDPKTEKFQSWAIPSGGVHAGIVRHMRPTRDGGLILHQSSTNRIILMTPARKVAGR